jgi:hypothetical protein
VTSFCTRHTVSNVQQDRKSAQRLVTSVSFEPQLWLLQTAFSFLFSSRSTSYVSLFRDSLCVVQVHTAPDADGFFIQFRMLCGVRRWWGLIFCTEMYPLYPGVCVGNAGLAVCVAYLSIAGAKSAYAKVLRSTGHSSPQLNALRCCNHAAPTSEAVCSSAVCDG